MDSMQLFKSAFPPPISRSCANAFISGFLPGKVRAQVSKGPSILDV